MSNATIPTLTTGQAAAYLGISVFTLRNYANEGKLPCSRVDGGHRRFELTDLVTFRNTRRKDRKKRVIHPASIRAGTKNLKQARLKVQGGLMKRFVLRVASWL